MPNLDPTTVPTILVGNLFNRLTTDDQINVRWLTATDPVHFSALNRPLSDVAFRQLILAKAFDRLGTELGDSKYFPFVQQPELISDGQVIKVPTVLVRSFTLTVPNFAKFVRLSRIRRIGGANTPSYTGTIRFIFTHNDADDAETPLFYIDYIIDSQSEYQVSKVTTITGDQITGAAGYARYLDPADAGRVAGEITFRTVPFIDTEITAFYDALAIDQNYDIIDLSDEFNGVAVAHGMGLLTQTAFNYDSGAIQWGHIVGGDPYAQADLKDALDAKANLSGATFTGPVSIPQAAGTAQIHHIHGQRIDLDGSLFCNGIASGSYCSFTTLSTSGIASFGGNITGTTAWFSGKIVAGTTVAGFPSGGAPGIVCGDNTGDETQARIKTKLGAASTSTDGYLTSADWNMFNSKFNLPAFTSADIHKWLHVDATGNTTSWQLMDIDHVGWRNGQPSLLRAELDGKADLSGDTFTGAVRFNADLTLNGVSVIPGMPNANASGPGLIPAGGIIMWSGSVANIPLGWVLCNGSNGTPDLRARFVVGINPVSGGNPALDTYDVGTTGGSSTHSHTNVTGSTILTNAMIPDHRHQIKSYCLARHWHGDGTVTGDAGVATKPAGDYDDGRLDADHAKVGYTEYWGRTAPDGHTHTINNTAKDHRPKFYALAYIMKK
jgi:hypothetical protein